MRIIEIQHLGNAAKLLQRDLERAQEAAAAHSAHLQAADQPHSADQPRRAIVKDARDTKAIERILKKI